MENNISENHSHAYLPRFGCCSDIKIMKIMQSLQQWSLFNQFCFNSVQAKVYHVAVDCTFAFECEGTVEIDTNHMAL